MAIKMERGDYFLRPGGTVRLRGDEAVLADALFRLQCVRGSFPFLPELGSRLWRLGLERSGDRPALARQYCAEALAGSGVEVLEVNIREQGQALAVEVTLGLGAQRVNVEVSV